MICYIYSLVYVYAFLWWTICLYVPYDLCAVSILKHSLRYRIDNIVFWMLYEILIPNFIYFFFVMWDAIDNLRYIIWPPAVRLKLEHPYNLMRAHAREATPVQARICFVSITFLRACPTHFLLADASHTFQRGKEPLGWINNLSWLHGVGSQYYYYLIFYSRRWKNNYKEHGSFLRVFSNNN